MSDRSHLYRQHRPERANRTGSHVGNQLRALIKRFFIYKWHRPKSTLFLDIVLPIFQIVLLMINLHFGSLDLKIMQIENLLVFFRQFVSITNWLALDELNGMRHLMQSMGLNFKVYYLSNFICTMLQLVPFGLILGLIYGTMDANHSSGLLVSMVLTQLLYVIQLVAIMFALVSLIHSKQLLYLCFAFAPVDFMLNQLRRFLLEKYVKFDTLRLIIVYLCTISPQESLRLIACESTSGEERTDICDQLFYEGFKATHKAVIFALMLAWSVILIVFAMYFDFVCPWQKYRSPKNPLFFLKESVKPTMGAAGQKTAYMNRALSGSVLNQQDGVNLNEIVHEGQLKPESIKNDPFDKRDPRYFESAPKSLPTAIEVQEVSKQFLGASEPSVNRLSFNIYYGQTTLLLGHNGAGKTTLMNMINGSIDPSEGQILIHRQDRVTLPNDTTNLGLCPQESILADYLTIEQHLMLFLNIKLADDDKLVESTPEEHIESVLTDIGLLNERYKKPQQLSGGMKRKLSLGMAFVADSKILILDEPSSGLDPESRRFVWDAIRRYKSRRAVLLSTQHMEEADYLSDRVAIMSQGEIICCGCSSFLKQRFNCAYKLRLECQSSQFISNIMNLIREQFPLAKILSTGNHQPEEQQIPGEQSQAAAALTSVDLQVELRTESGDNQQEPNEALDDAFDERMINLLDSLESRSSSVGIKSFGIQCASIEDVLQSTIDEASWMKASRRAVVGATEIQMDSNQEERERSLKTIEESRARSYYPNLSVWGIISTFLVKHLYCSLHLWFTMLSLRILIPGFLLYIFMRIIYINLQLASIKNDPNVFSAMMIQQLAAIPTFLGFHIVSIVSKERLSKFKLVQLTSPNANRFYYWVSQLIFDLITTSLLHTIIFGILSEISYFGGFDEVTFKALGGHWVFHVNMLIVFILFGVCNHLMAYVISCMNDSVQKATFWYVVVNYSSIITQLLWSILLLTTLVTQDQLEWTKHVDDLYNHIIPTNLFVGTLTKFFQAALINQNSGTNQIAVYSWSHGYSKLLLNSIAVATALVALLYIAEMTNWLNRINIFNKISDYVVSMFRISWYSNPTVETDDDVIAEERRISRIMDNHIGGDQALLVHQLTKSFGPKKAVRELSFGVAKNECFGLLGVNGAGKTTTFSMLMGDMERDSGRIICQGVDIDQGIQSYRKQLGFDPQQNYDLDMTPMEALRFMAKLRNVHPDDIEPVINAIVNLLQLRPHCKKLIKNMSGGTKRKFTLAIALIGLPPFVMLDEPTAGIDPIARRDIWSLLCSMKSKANQQQDLLRTYSTSILISSHAMEECEAICDRLTIMIAGQMRCLGTFQHLREKYGHGFTVKIQFTHGIDKEEDNLRTEAKTIQKTLSDYLGGAKVDLDNTTTGGLVFKIINQDNILRSQVYRSLREMKQRSQQTSKFSFLLSDSTLEDLFSYMSKRSKIVN